jgi:hypothetical protein
MGISNILVRSPDSRFLKFIRRGILPLMLGCAGALVMTPNEAAADQIAYITGGTNIWSWNTTTNSISVLTNRAPA